MDNKLKKIILLAGDIGILYLSLYLTLLIRYWDKPTSSLWQSHVWPFTIIFAAWILIFYISNLYDLNLAANNANFFRLTAKGLLITGLLSVAFFYLTPQISIAPKRNLLIYVVIFAVLFSLWRQFFNWSLKSYLPKNNIAFVGLNNQVLELIKELKQKPHLGYSVAFVVDDKNTGRESIEGIQIFNDVSRLYSLISSKKITNIILTSDPHQSEELRTVLFGCLPLKISYTSLPNFYENITGRVPIESINQMWFLENLSEGRKSLFGFTKRLYDFTLALLILFGTLIFWPVIGIIIKLGSKGPIFFRQTRTGKGNKPFKIIKFRTMTVMNNNFSPTAKDDNRITKFGSFLRKTRIDEIPQVINILSGEMSFVGPRPERPELIEELEGKIPFYNERLLVKPGITGWDQISGEYHSPSQEDTLKKLQYDLFYIKNRSIYLDISILLKTITTIISHKGV
ncbi:MAG: sugar transferase [Patescibacteria group bacterium]|nr:sugar transferase [Patescibacteria group bacterium]MDD5554625.1 sugar transferase [Patescibacteria group bacterium]